MRIILLIILTICFATVCNAQNNNSCEIYTLDGDTIEGEFIQFIGNFKEIQCHVNGSSKFYSSKQTLGFKVNDEKFHSGKFPIFLGLKKWGFASIIIEGELNMYGLYLSEFTQRSDGRFKTQDMNKYYIRKGVESRGNFVGMGLTSKRRLLRAGKNCPLFIEEMEGWKYTLSTIKSMVNFYNSECY